MEKIKELYEELKAEVLTKRKKSSKAEKIRSYIVNLSDYLDDTTLCLEAVYTLACRNVPCSTPIGKVYFKQVISKAWVVERDEWGNDWIKVDQPRRKK